VLDKEAINSHLSSKQCAGKIGGCPYLRSQVDSRSADEVEGRRALNVADDK
jgi:hypothetical protein